ncbi:hypothetical protein NEMBOFW57_003595 [Staphylotrichum longicolle]|uniref:Methyltransferase n=1 Tax=Staphylotrichum longicolle TaxID=669026 RepID=A0AAD4FA74_9PEZI|nr:hypothetical protein NEMBOFW57_003595 [Staphylotrichum longicolle]
MTTAGDFRYLDPSTISPSTKPWSKVDGAATSYTLTSRRRSVTNIRDCLGLHSQRGSFGTDIDVSGFAVYHAPAQSTDFSSDSAVRTSYYPEVEALLRAKLPGKIANVTIFDHTIRRHDPTSPRQPVQQVHVDQTPRAAEARVRRHVKLPPAELDALLKRRYQLINVWRPISHPASDFPLAVVDWRTTTPADLVPVDLLYPLHHRTNGDEDDDRGKETLPDLSKADSTEGYEVKGETYGVLPGEGHKFYYCKDMTPEEAMFIKCFDSWGEGKEGGRKGIAALTPHTAFIDPATPAGVKGRESIEVRCLVFYDE